MKARKASPKGRRSRSAAARTASTPPAPNPPAAQTLRALTDAILVEESRIREGGGAGGHERQLRLGRLPVRQRLEQLLDADAPFLELNLWAAWNMYPEAGEIPAAGVVTGIGQVHGRPCMIVANDATVKAGAFFPATCKKVLRAQRIATRCNLPLLYLVDSSGVYLPMQDEIFPDEDDFGRVFRNNAVLSAMGVPQYAAIMGNCVAGGAYLPVLCDKVLMTEDSELYLAGPSLVKAAIGQDVDAKALGGTHTHGAVGGTIDFVEKDDSACLAKLRALVDLLPETTSTALALAPGSAPEPTSTTRPAKGSEHVYDLINADGHGEYDVHDLLDCVADAGFLIAYKSDYGKSLVCAYASIAGQKLGIVANQRIRTRTAEGEVHIGGVIYPDAADKAARFVMDCTQTGLPLLFVQDVVGFMVGPEVEGQGIIRRGAKLVSAVSNSAAPKITLIVGGSFGAGHYALCGKAFDPAFIFAWPNARYAVMGAGQAAGTLLDVRRRQEKREGRTRSEEELADLYQSLKKTYEQQTDIRYGAARGWVDAIIPPHTTRDVLSQALRLVTRPPPPGGFRAGVFQV